jgi:hypothetical protein
MKPRISRISQIFRGWHKRTRRSTPGTVEQVVGGVLRLGTCFLHTLAAAKRSHACDCVLVCAGLGSGGSAGGST